MNPQTINDKKLWSYGREWPFASDVESLGDDTYRVFYTKEDIEAATGWAQAIIGIIPGLSAVVASGIVGQSSAHMQDYSVDIHNLGSYSSWSDNIQAWK